MKNRILTIYLFAAGLIMMAVGGYIGLEPSGYFTTMMLDAELPPSTNMLSDLRGMGGVLLMFGLITLISAFKPGWMSFGLNASALVYSAFVVFRGLGFLLEGLPEAEILIAWSIEILMMLAGGWLIARKHSASGVACSC